MNTNLFRRTPAIVAAVLGAILLTSQATRGEEYAVVVSRQTQANPAWRRVVDVLRENHQGTVIVYDASVEESLPALRRQFPRYACFVAQPQEATREFVAQVHQLTRKLDDDPYTDVFWGILTGYNAETALRIASCTKRLTVHKVAGGTEVALNSCDEGVWYCELKQGRMVQKQPGKEPQELKGPADTTAALVNTLNDYAADLFVTSGHATEHDWQIGYAYRNGQFRCENGVLFGLDTQSKRYPVHSPNPKVYLPIGNCLMGHIDNTNAMALAWMNSGGVNQMIGYTVTTWYGYAGWGCLDYFVEQPGRYTFTEAFFANQAALMHRLLTYFPGLAQAPNPVNGRLPAPGKPSEKAQQAGLNPNDGRGLLYDRDVLAFYGDPAWEARMDKHPCAWDQTLTENNGVYTFDLKPNRGEQTFEPINKNGSQRGGRPIVQFLPQRIKNIRILEGEDLAPVITDNFILVPNPRTCDPQKQYRVRFTAKTIKPATSN